jgi:hypothetical protein
LVSLQDAPATNDPATIDHAAFRSGCGLMQQGCHKKTGREDDMAIDATLWFILAGVVALIYCGCVFTAPKRNSSGLRHGTFEH